MNAFANLLAVAHEDKVQTSTEKSSIGSVSLGEGGFMSHTADLSDNVETVTSHKAQLRLERHPCVFNETNTNLHTTLLFLYVLMRVSQI